jgi:prophage regulatory protein
MNERLLRRPAVSEKTGYSTSEIYDKMNRGEFPRPVPVGVRAVAWLQSEVEAHIAKLKAKRDEGLMLPRRAPGRRHRHVEQVSA